MIFFFSALEPQSTREVPAAAEPGRGKGSFSPVQKNRLLTLWELESCFWERLS